MEPAPDGAGGWRVFCGNITRFGPMARTYLASRREDLCGAILIETHLRDQPLEEERRRLLQAGWRSHFCPGQASVDAHGGARASCEALAEEGAVPLGGTRGGVAILLRSHLMAHDLSLVEMKAPPQDLAVTQLSIKGRVLSLVAIYLRPELPTTPENVQRLRDAASVLTTLCGPWVAFGDWNCTPAQLADTGWLELTEGAVVQASDTVVTCRMGEQQRLLDFAVASPTAAPWVSLHLTAAPWKAHAGFDLVVQGAPPVLQGWRLRRPARLPGVEAPEPTSGTSKTARRKALRAAEQAAQRRREQLSQEDTWVPDANEPPDLLEEETLAEARRLDESFAAEFGATEAHEGRAARADLDDPEPVAPPPRAASAEPGPDILENTTGPEQAPEQAPAPLPMPVLPAWHSAAANIKWASAVVQADCLPPVKCRSDPSRCLDAGAVQRLTAQTGQWLRAVEIYFADAAGLAPPHARQASSRADGIAFVWAKAPKKKLRSINVNEEKAAWMAQLAAVTQEYRGLLKQPDRTARQRQTRAVHVAHLVAARPQQLPALDVPDPEWPCQEEPSPQLSWPRLLRALAALPRLTAAHLDRLLPVVRWACDKLLAKAVAEASASFAAWSTAAAEQNGKGRLFRWIKDDYREAAPVGLPEAQLDPTQAIVTLLEAKRQHWAEVWRDASDLGALGQVEEPLALHDLLAEARALRDEQGHALPRLTHAEFERALARHRPTTGLGADHMSPLDFRKLPSAAREALYDLWDACEESWCWPAQWSVQLVHLVPRPGRTDRAIHALPMAVRLWGSARAWVSDAWCQEEAQFWDEAIRGSSALQAVMRRCVKDECWTACGVTSMCGLLDVAGYYDSLEFPLLLREARRWRYPGQVLCLSLAQYMCPRHLVWQGWASPHALVPGRGAGTGERHGNHMARLGLYEILRHLHSQVPSVLVAQWVDDVPLRCYGGPRWVEDQMFAAVALLRREFDAASLVLASKSVLVSSDAAAARRLQRRLAAVGIQMAVAAEAPDLGIDVGAGNRRAQAKHVGRRAKARRKCDKVRQLRFAKRVAGGPARKHLWKAAVLPQAAYGQTMTGMTDTDIQQQRRALGHSLDRGKKGRCLTALIAAAAENDDPWLAHIQRCAEEFLKFWKATDETTAALVRRAWPKIVAARQAFRRRRRVLRCWGPISTLLHTLHSIGWRLHSPDEWTDRAGTRWQFFDRGLLDRDTIAPLLEQLRTDVWTILWRRSNPRPADGLQTPPCSRTLRTLLQRYQRKKQHQEYSALLAFACAGTWPAQRKFECKLAATGCCPRCGEHNETLRHLLWECPRNKELPTYDAKTSAAALASLDDADKHEDALWLQGQLVASRLPDLPPPDEFEDLSELPLGYFAAEGYAQGWALIFGDASGGEHASHPLLRRIGAGLVQMCLDTRSQLASATFSVPGRQEVGRGELYAFLRALELTPGPLLYVTDRKSVWEIWRYQKWRKPAWAWDRGQNSDLLRRLAPLLMSREVQVVLTESHSTDEEIERGFCSRILALGNTWADAAADRAAHRARVPFHLARQVEYVEDLTRRIRLHAVACITASRDAAPAVVRNSAPPAAAVPRVPVVLQELQKADHVVEVLPNGIWRCTRCWCTIPSVRRTEWLRQNPCQAYEVTSHDGGADRLAADSLLPLWGRRPMHPSHSGVWFHAARAWGCVACGAWAAQRAKKLAEECQPHASSSNAGRCARVAISSLARGVIPYSQCQSRQTRRPPPREARPRPASAPPRLRPAEPPPPPEPPEESSAAERLRRLRERVRAREAREEP